MINKFLSILICVVIASQVTYAQNYKFGKVSKEELQETEHKEFKEAHASVLFRKTNTTFNYTADNGFSITTDFHERIKIYDNEGYDYATKLVGLYVNGSEKESMSGLKAVTYNLVNGKIEESKLKGNGVFTEEINKNVKGKKFTMPDINNGCVIEYKYSVTSPFISNIDEFVFQDDIPVDNVEMRFVAPEYFNYRTHGRGVIPLNIDNSSKTRRITYHYSAKGETGFEGRERRTSKLEFEEKIYNISLQNIPPMVHEPYSTNTDNYISSLKFELAFTKFPNSSINNYATTWEDVSKEIYKSKNFGVQLEKSQYFKDELKKLTLDSKSTQKKISNIYNFVKDKMNWNEYYGVYTDEGVKGAYKNSVGNVADINLILISMLREAGINCNPVLISTKSNGIPLFPTRVGFNYVVAQVVIGEESILLDAVDKLGQPNILKPNLLNWNGRVIREDGTSEWVSLYPKNSSRQNTFMVVSIDDDLVVSGNAKNRYTGHYAHSLRSRYGSLSDEDQLKNLQEQYDETDIISLSFSDLNTDSKNITVNYDFEIEDGVEEIGGKLYISPLVHLATKENVFKSETRVNPVDFMYAQEDRYSISIDIPDGYEVESLPAKASVGLPENMGVFTYNTSVALNKVNVAIHSRINTPIISANYYIALKEYFKVMIEKENEKIVFKKI